MPASLTYPGVYIEELPSGVNTITGVATSITAFVGWANQGPTDQATLVESWSDFATQFGGFNSNSYLGYCVNQFFNNGGQQAYVVRLVWDGSLPAAPNTSPAPSATAYVVDLGLATSVITAQTGSVQGSATFTVGTPILQSLAITPSPAPWLQVGQTFQLVATGTNSDTTTPVLTNSVAWSSGSPSVTVSHSGLITAVSPGVAIVTATSGAVTTNITITVKALLNGIVIAPAAPSVAVGQTVQFSATGNFSDATSQDLTAFATWAAGPGATITTGGLATGVTAGSTPTVTATYAGVSSNQAKLTVNPKVLVSIAVSPANLAWIQVGGTQPKFTASGSFSDSTSEALTNLTTPAVTWNSSNNSVVTIDPTGQVTAVTPGSVFITATSGGVTSTPVALTVTTSTLSSIAITPAAPSVAAGLTVQFTAVGTYSPDNATQDLTAVVTWGATAGATISATGLATAAKVPGSSTISAALGGVNAPGVTLNVTAAVLQSIAVTPANQSILPGATQNFAAIGTMSDGTTPSLTGSVTWSSGTPTVATITSGGVATAVASGGTLTLFASNPGQWGNAIQVSVTPGSPGRFGVQVQYQGKVVENFVNLSVTSTDPQYVVTVIDSDSQYLSFINPVNNQPVIPTAAPAGTAAASAAPFLAGGVDGAVLTPASDGNFELAMLKAGAGVNLLDRVDIFNLLCVPSESDGPTIQLLQDYCFSKRAFYLVDSPQLATISGLTSSGPVGGNNSGPITAGNANYSAFYFPWVWAPDPLFGNRTRLFPPCGFVAGIYAATDAARGVWKAPAGIGAGLSGESGLQYTLTDQENGDLNTQAINCLRTFKVYGDVVWGARTLQGNDQTGSQWKYVPIRRLALYIESSLYDGTQWAVFEPNDETLWSQVRLDIGAFMQGLFLQGAFQGTTPSQAYFVKCDSENNPQTSISLGILNVLVGFSPLYPAEFVVIEIQQMAGQSQS